MELFNALYNQLLLRDVLGYTVPGAIVCAALGARLFGFGWLKASQGLPLKAVSNLLLVVILVPVLGLFYIVGNAIQGLAFETLPGRCLFKYHQLRNDDAFGQRITNFNHALSKLEPAEAAAHKQQRERFVVLKHVSANGAIAILLGGFLLASIAAIRDSILPLKGWTRSAGVVLGLGILLGVSFLLYRVHVATRNRQDILEAEVISRIPSTISCPVASCSFSSGQPGPCPIHHVDCAYVFYTCPPDKQGDPSHFALHVSGRCERCGKELVKAKR